MSHTSPTLTVIHSQPCTAGTLTVIRSQFGPLMGTQRLSCEITSANGELRSSYAVGLTWEHDVELLTGIKIVSVPSL